MARSAVFDQTYQDYLDRIGRMDIGVVHAKLGITWDGQSAEIPLFGRKYQVSAQWIRDERGRRPELAVCVILCKYILMCPDTTPTAREPATFKDFRDAAPLVHFFNNEVEGAIARRFAGRPSDLETACRKIGGQPHIADLAYQLKYRFTGLPRIPLVLLFNDADDEFPAQCTILFERSVQHYLDMESLAMLGGVLADALKKS